MESPLLHEQSPAAYFKELLDSALARQHVTAGDLTAYYLVNLLCQFVRADACESFGRDAEPLALQLARALGQPADRSSGRSFEASGISLFSCPASFADSFPRRAVDVDYYVSMGEYAYGSLSRQDRGRLRGGVRRALTQVRRFYWTCWRTSASTPARLSRNDALRLYEKWLRTGSARDGQRLLDRGIVPNASIGKRFIQ